MGREITLFKSKELKSRNEVSAFLHDLADKIAAGEVTLSKGQEQMPISIPKQLMLEVEVEEENKKRKGKQHCLEVELKWYENNDTYSALELK